MIKCIIAEYFLQIIICRKKGNVQEVCRKWGGQADDYFDVRSLLQNPFFWFLFLNNQKVSKKEDSTNMEDRRYESKNRFRL